MAMVLSMNERTARLKHGAALLKELAGSHARVASTEAQMLAQGEQQSLIASSIDPLLVELSGVLTETIDYLESINWTRQVKVDPAKSILIEGLNITDAETIGTDGEEVNAFATLAAGDLVRISGATTEANNGVWEMKSAYSPGSSIKINSGTLTTTPATTYPESNPNMVITLIER